MPAISKIRLANVIYEEGNKRYNDELFLFDGYNGAILLENGGGKTVLIQTALQAMLPHTELASRKIGKTLTLASAPAHIAVEWIINDKPRRYVVTAVTLFMNKHGLDSLRYVYEYQQGDPHAIEEIPFVREVQGGKRPAERGEMQDYYSAMKDKSLSANTFNTIKDYRAYIEDNYQIISNEWESIVKINSSEGGVEAFFEACKTTNQLFDRLLIPTVERAMAGHDETLFADLFEQRYTSFKNYQKLKETIKENEKIQEELTGYTTAFARLHSKEQDFLEAKQQTKGIWEQTVEQKQAFEAERESLQAKEISLQQDMDQHQVKVSSHEIAEKVAEIQEIKKNYDNAHLVLKEQKEKVEEVESHRAALRYAKFTKDKHAAEQALIFIQEQIASSEKKFDLEEIQDQLTEAEQALHGAYLSQIESIGNDRKDLQLEKNPLQQQVVTLKQQCETYLKVKQSLNNEVIKLTSFIENREKDSEQLRQSLLANPEQEKVEEQLPTWESRYQALDNEITQLKTDKKRFVREAEEKRQEKQELRETLQQNGLQSQQVEQHLNTMKEDEQQLVQSLAMLKSNWQNIAGIHLQQESIQGQLESNLEKQRIERKKWLDKERLALRYVDDYGEQDTFFSDPFLAKQIEIWKNQIDYIETGIDYLSQLPSEKQELLKQEALWPSIIVTTEKAKPRLMERLEQVSDRIMMPVMIVSTEEATSLTDMEKGNWIVPNHWSKNIDGDQFSTWKQKLEQHAKDITNTREHTENELKSWEHALNQFLHFLKKYPYDQVVSWQEDMSNLQTVKEKTEAIMRQVEKYLGDLNQSIDKNAKRTEEAEAERTGMERKLQDGQQYENYQKEITKHTLDKKKHNEEQQAVERKVKQTTRALDRYEEDIKLLDERMRELEVEKEKVQSNPYYQEVSGLSASYTGEDVTILLTKRKELLRQKDRISRQIGEWEAKQETERQRIQTTNERMYEIEQDYPTVDKNLDFPADGDYYIERLKGQIQTSKKKLAQIMETYQGFKLEFSNKEVLLDQAYKDFRLTFPQDVIIEFEGNLSEVKQQIQTEQIDLQKRKGFLEQEFKRVDKELGSLEESQRLLENFIEGYHFNAPGIASIALDDQEALDFQYQRKHFAKKSTDRLKEVKRLVEEERKLVHDAKDKFRAFCRSKITDKKLQQMAIQGVEQKRDYEEVITFKQNMFASIQRITKYANEHIRKSDEELQLFINQIHTHLETLVEELEQIPKKTRVKVDNWKAIYSFSIPKWESGDGKLRIRNHTEWIINQLDSDKYQDEQGHQDMNKVRIDLEKWLESKQLLKAVMDRDVMKVHCRKVTNDNQVSNRSYTWEQSNVWSGGEKWSKNMTLFLGIQKYVAEKKKANLTNRAVILDNPFGKASSDHVLSPVFFIADQLGFQIIALTAHAEGKFLQDYFPIIYSCRLRASKDANKKVMTTDKWLHHAYFQDHEPAVIGRLGQTEQQQLDLSE
ncbi:hypothetical protein [Oceanobacillus massiliensis]|uniref:hypothetical protein n=1 Tax=Oceanobacillus massiliensis TaxID=1465765 RepID=UPI0002897F1B|nr:hypothetical protein [Oceanobacillus massiliensis]